MRFIVWRRFKWVIIGLLILLVLLLFLAVLLYSLPVGSPSLLSGLSLGHCVLKCLPVFAGAPIQKSDPLSILVLPPLHIWKMCCDVSSD